MEGLGFRGAPRPPLIGTGAALIPEERGGQGAKVTTPQPLGRVGGAGPGAVLAGAGFAVSRLAWSWSTVAEVFSLNNLFIGLLFSLAACFHRADSAPRRRKFAQWGALCCGLGLCNQHTLVLYVAIIVPWVLLRLHSHQRLPEDSPWLLGGVAVVLALCGLLPYLYLPASSYHNAARWSWGDQTSLSGLITHLLRTEYGTFSLAKTESAVSLAVMLWAQLDHCVADLSPPVLVLAGAAAVLSCRAGRRCVVSWLLISALLLYSLFFAWRANLDIQRPLLLGVVERFWLQSDAALCVLSGLGLCGLQGALTQRLGRGALWSAGGWAFTAALVAHLAQSNHRECCPGRNGVAEQFARGLLDSVPRDSIILTRGDLPGNTLRYLHYCQGLRPDLSLVDQEMMTYGWYVEKLGPHHDRVHFPGRRWDPVPSEGKDTFTLEQFLLHNAQRAVFACIGLPDGDPSWQRSFSRWPWGVCDQLVPAQTQLRPEEWAQRTRNMFNLTHPHHSFHPGSWERVANEEMWQASMKTAFFLFDLAERTEEGETSMRLFDLSYTLYKEIVEQHEDHPSNWDKNMALASERLLRAGGRGHSQEGLLSESIKYFSLYLTKEPADPQAEAIRSALAHLLRERRRLRDTHAP
ncbi:hypothetical protein AAFF_G00100030 [Aldrovandia affinis]|uniref:Transmembrane protein 260 n=1 Tax=Aldrovandia affinis TaxID=143900 RepID=A0AAD7RUY0_9TELE|nr:hypothetical protein AAFF_G00100030 [Aldrovandia affinis]